MQLRTLGRTGAGQHPRTRRHELRQDRSHQPTSAIIGPRTIDHMRSQLAAADTVLPTDVLDAIDKIVAPGLDLAAHIVGSLAEACTIIRRQWTESDPSDFDGEFHQLVGGSGNHKQMQRPHPTILIGGRSAATLRVAAGAITEAINAGFAHIIFGLPAPYPDSIGQWAADEIITRSEHHVGTDGVRP